MRFFLALSLASTLLADVRPQGTAPTEGILLPPKSNLVPLHLPDLTQVEAEIREQIGATQNALIVAAKDPTTSDAKLSERYGVLGEVYQAYSVTAPARECYLNAIRLAPKDFRWIYLLAKLDHQEGRVYEAIRHYRTADTLRKGYLALPVNLGNIYLELNRLEEAQSSFKAALEIEGNNAAALYGLGQVALSRRSYAEAVVYFEQALKSAPAANRIHYALGMAYRGAGNAERAKLHLGQQGSVGVRAADPLVDRLRELIKGERLHLIRGRVALEAKSYAEAAREFRRAIDANPNSVPARVNLGVALTQTGDLKGAAEQFEATLRIDPENTNARYNLAVLLANENKHDDAIAHLQAVIKSNATDLSARFFLAQVLSRSGSVDAALVEFARIVQADANNEEALLERVKLLNQRRKYSQALEELERGHAQYPQKAATAGALAYMLAASPQLDLRNGARALELARVAYKATVALEHGALVAMALAELGRCQEAAEWQREMITAAEHMQVTNLLAKLRLDLRRYEEARPCRPVSK